MELRLELVPPKISDELVSQLVKIVEEVDRRHRNNDDYSSLLVEFKKLAGIEMDIELMMTYLETCDPGIEAVIRNELTPRPLKLNNITDEEYLEILRRIR